MDKHITHSRLLRGLLLAALLVPVGCSEDSDDETAPNDGGDARDDAGEGSDSGPRDADIVDAGAALDGEADAAVTPLPGELYAVTSEQRLVSFELASGKLATSVMITGVDDEKILGADVRPADSTIYLLGSAGNLYTLDAETGVATLKAGLMADPADASEPYGALSGDAFGVDFNPVADRLRIVSNSGQNLRINVDTGATTSDRALAPATAGASAAAYTNSFASACRTKLFVLDGSSGKLLLQDPPNEGTLTEIGSLGDVGQVHTFEIRTAADGADQGFIVASRDGRERVARLDLSTGVASAVSDLQLASGESVVALLSMPPASPPTQPRGELLAMTGSNRLLSFNRAAPGRLCTSAPITGITGEIVGADVRPADGSLYALTRQGGLYTIALDNAQATLVATLAADGSDATDPFVALSGDSFGVGFNPVPDRLRIVSSSGANLRVNVSTGATITDTNLTVAGLSAVAYTNSFAGAQSTTLYALDTAADTLVRVGASPATASACPDLGNPNCGVVSSVGALAVGDVTGINGFDIDPVSGVALAALTIGQGASSSLFAIDLSSGKASSLGASIGGGESVVALVLGAQPTLTAYALAAEDRLVTFSPNMPSTPTASVATQGL